MRKREEEEIVLSGGDDGEEAAVGGNGEVAKGQVVEDGLRGGLENGNVLAGLLDGERGDVDPNDVAGFSFGSALEEDAVSIGRPLQRAEADTKANEMIGSA